MQREKIPFFLVICVTLTLIPCCQKTDATAESRPNIIFIMADDHAAHAVSVYGSRINRTPHIDRIAIEGIRFTNCFCTNSICAPSRAVILTGTYSHLNGVRDNAVSFDGTQTTFPKILQNEGYQTAMIGKWHLKSEPTGFDYWNVLPGQGQYYNPDLIEMGEKKQHSGYVTDILTDIALDFLKNRRNPSKPFLLMLHHKAPHRNWQPAARHLDVYDDVVFPEPETLFDDYATRSRAASDQEMTLRRHMRVDQDVKMGDPPQRLDDEQRTAWETVYRPKRETFREEKPEGEAFVRWIYKRYMEDYLGCIAAIDESVGRLLDYLDESGLAENTVVVYTSDQGFFLGDHGWYDKRFMYEESLRMPLVVRYPGRIEPGSVGGHIVSNLDFAPTFLDLAGAEIPAAMQGRSLRKLLSNEAVDGWRRSLYYHYYEYPAVHMTKRHYGVRTERYKLMHFYYDIDAWELYDLEKDPNEINNVYDNPAYTDVVTELKAEIERLQNLYGDSEELAQKFLRQDLERQNKK
ncbi:MAG: sulfatase [Candidatus Aminicenantes bacterium]